MKALVGIHCWIECKMVQPLRRWHFIIKLTYISPLCNNLLLDITQEKCKPLAHKNLYMNTDNSFFHNTKNWEQLKNLCTEECISCDISIQWNIAKPWKGTNYWEHRHCAKWKKADSTGYILFDSINRTPSKRQNDRDRKHINYCQELKVEHRINPNGCLRILSGDGTLLYLGWGGSYVASLLCQNWEPHTKLGEFYGSRQHTRSLSHLGPYILIEKHPCKLALMVLSDDH